MDPKDLLIKELQLKITALERELQPHRNLYRHKETDDIYNVVGAGSFKISPDDGWREAIFYRNAEGEIFGRPASYFYEKFDKM